MVKHLKTNKRLLRHTPLFVVVLLIFSCKKSTESALAIPFLEEDIKVDAVLDPKEWDKAVVIQNLSSPWDEHGQDKTIFRGYFSKTHFNFSFQVMDSTVVTVPFKRELSVAEEDRVELFFSKDTTLTSYFCIEIDPNGNVLDYAAQHYRKFKEDWNFESEKVATRILDTGYIVEGQISLQELTQLGITSPFYLGVFRADFKSNKPDDVTWHTWITPMSKEPDFHVPSAFGKTILSD